MPLPWTVSMTTGAFMGVFASGGGLSYPVDLVFDPRGNLYVSGLTSHGVKRYDGTTGAFIDTFVPDSPPTLTDPRYLIFTGDPPTPGNLRGTAINAFAVDLEWVDNARPPNNEDYVQIWLSTDGPSFACYEQTGGPDFTIFEDRAGDPHPYGENRYSFSGDTRFYRVRACGSFGCSAFSNVARPSAEFDCLRMADKRPVHGSG